MDLLASYNSDSGSENDDSEDFFAERKEDEDLEEPKKVELGEDVGTSKQVNSQAPTTSSFFFSGDAGTSDSESDDEEGDGKMKKSTRKRKAGEITELSGNFESAIFDNDFAREERTKMRMLSQHVELSDKPEISKKKSKYTCKAYLRGKCRFGDSCRYAHPVHDRTVENGDGVSVSSGATFYTETQEAQVFHSKKFKSSAGQ